VQAPAEHAALLQACALAQVPVAPQACTASPEHRITPGVQTPVQAPIEHA